MSPQPIQADSFLFDNKAVRFDAPESRGNSLVTSGSKNLEQLAEYSIGEKMELVSTDLIDFFIRSVTPSENRRPLELIPTFLDEAHLPLNEVQAFSVSGGSPLALAYFGANKKTSTATTVVGMRAPVLESFLHWVKTLRFTAVPTREQPLDLYFEVGTGTYDPPLTLPCNIKVLFPLVKGYIVHSGIADGVLRIASMKQ